MSKTRQQSRRRRARRPDGSTWVRTFPVTFLHDVSQHRRDDDWHLLTYAVRGHLEVVTADNRHAVPADRAVWIPAGTPHTAVMRAPISMRSLFIARQVFRDRRLASGGVRTVAVTPLLRELILQITRLGALDVQRPAQQRLCGVLFDLVRGADDVDLELALPHDPRARAFADLVMTAPGDPRSLAVLARAAGASLRTLERCFVLETGLGVGAWRRRVRLFHALRLLEAGEQVSRVADDVGYATVSAFSHAFRAQFGRSPTGRTRAR